MNGNKAKNELKGTTRDKDEWIALDYDLYCKHTPPQDYRMVTGVEEYLWYRYINAVNIRLGRYCLFHQMEATEKVCNYE